MVKNKINTYVIAGVFLTYYGLSDKDFTIWYNGVAHVLGIVAFIAAYLEYRKSKKKTDAE